MSIQHVLVIAEAGVNHNGSLAAALELVDAAAAAGADAVKFQTFRSEAVISKGARKAQYQIANTGNDESQLEMVRRLELDEVAHRRLLERARAKGIQFLSTPFDLESLRLLQSFALPRLKIASGEITNLPLLLAAARSGCELIVSTGMCTLGEVERALQAIAFGFAAPTGEHPTAEALAAAYASPAARELLRQRLILLHCTTEYPAPVADANLRVMRTMAAAFGVPVGYSDHTTGIHVPIAAVACGAIAIEKHFTLDRRQPGPDHIASLEPAELTAMVSAIRDVELAIGTGWKVPAQSETKNIPIARKSLVAACSIRRGEAFSEVNLTTKRPGSGVSAWKYFDYLGRTATRDYAADELLDEP
jgi:N-acetylneuraminate synthase